MTDAVDRQAGAREDAAGMLEFRAHLLGSVYDAMYVLRPDLTIVYWNDVAESLFGWTAAEAVGRSAREMLRKVVPGTTREEVLARVLEEGAFSGEATYRHRDGHEIHASVRARVARDEDGDVSEIVVTVRDVSEEVRTRQAVAASERALRESEARGRFLVELGDAMGAVVDPGEVAGVACRLVRRQLGVDRALYGEVRGGTFVLLGDAGSARGSGSFRHAIDGVAEPALVALRAGRTLQVDDLRADGARDALERAPFGDGGERAYVAVPLRRDGRLVAAFVVHQGVPRSWTPAEVSLLEEGASRAWPVVERAHEEEARRASEERYRLLADSLPEIVWTADVDGGSVSFNRRWYEFTGVHEWVDEPGARGIVSAAIHPEDQERLLEVFERARAEGQPFSCECRIYSIPLGDYKWFLVRGAPTRSRTGDVVQWVGTASDIDEQKRVEDEMRSSRSELQYRAHHDALTGLPNRLLFEDRLQLAMASAARHDRVLAVLFMDLDGFKLVNDALGHAAGDDVLEELARRLRAPLREEDTLARLHGDEFAVLLPELRDPVDAGHLARTLLGEIARPVAVRERPVTLSASIGISVYPRDGDDPLALLRAADAAMYKAKLGGKNDVRYFSAAMRAPVMERAALAEYLDGALDRGELDVCYQPQWDSRTGGVSCFEALLRWDSPDLGPVSPERFVPIAEERGAFGPIASWSLDVCGTGARTLSDGSGLPVRVALNVTPPRLARASFLPQVEATILRHALEPHQLDLEVTMGAAVEDAERLRAALDRLTEMGVRLTLDRFGPDAGLVALLPDLPFCGVKIEPHLVERAERDPRFRRGAAALVALAHDLGLDVTAVGVETDAQRDTMLELGCERLQGHLFGAPMSPLAARTLLRSQQVATLF